MSRYLELGVDVRKKGIKAFKNVVDNLYPGAFCVVSKDPKNPNRGLVSHSDSAGSKPILNYIAYKDTQDPIWFERIAQDVIAMNIDDIICVAAEPLVFIDYIAFNTIHIDRVAMLSSLAKGFSDCFNMLEENGMPILFGGGETADLPDQMRTLDVCGAIFCTVDLNKVVTGYDITPDDIIIGLRSGGELEYESKTNSGIMCNGFTLARNCLLSKEYLKNYPEIAHTEKGRYYGQFTLWDEPEGLEMSIGEALTSPTRIFAPIAASVLEKAGESVHGMIHNTGGGQTKCLGLGKGIKYVKDSLIKPDPIFHLIQQEGNIEWREMYEDFNMGVGFEFIVEPGSEDIIMDIVEKFNIGARVIGKCQKGPEENSLVIDSKHGKFLYKNNG